MKPSGALPWIAAALAHAVLLLLPIGIPGGPVAASRPPMTIDVTLTDATVRPPATPSGTASTRLAARALAAVAEAPRTDSPVPETPRGPAFRTVPEVTGVSSTLPPDAFAARSSPAPAQLGSGSAQGVSVETGPAIGWEGTPRVVIRKRDPRFPSTLSVSGQEVEGEARITVAPTGAVVRVEITRSTGYIEVDASIEAALRDYLFSRVDGRGDALGTVQFRFRLEKTD